MKIYVCTNHEVACNLLGAPLSASWRGEVAHAAAQAAGRALSDHGLDYDWCSDFRAYNGGPRRAAVEAVGDGAEGAAEGVAAALTAFYAAGAAAMAENEREDSEYAAQCEAEKAAQDAAD